MKSRILVPVATVIWISFSVHVSRAATVEVPGDVGDGLVDVNGVPVNLADPTIRPGTGGGPSASVVRGQAGIFFFQLPTISPSTITSADVQLAFLGFDGSPEFNLDVFGLGVRSSATILSSDYYAGSSANGSGALIETQFLTPNAIPGNFDIGLGSYLQTLYDPSGTPLGPFLVLRVNPDLPLPEPSAPSRGYVLATADNPDSSLVPQLLITTVPEPSSIIVAAAAGISFLVVGLIRGEITFRASRTERKGI